MKALLRSGFLALAIMAMTVPANAGPLEDANAANKRGDYATAFRLWRPLAEQGDAKAQYKLGTMYAMGRGPQQDDAEAVKWWRLAAEQGDTEAQYGLGFMHYRGQGVPQDVLLAHMWFNLAAAGNNVAGNYGRDLVAERMTPDQIVEAQRLAREWMEKHLQLWLRLEPVR